MFMKFKILFLSVLLLFLCGCTSYFESESECILDNQATILSEINETTYGIIDDQVTTILNKEETIDSTNEYDNNVLLTTPIIFSAYLFDDSYPELKGRSLVLEMVNGSYDTQRGYFQSIVQGDFRFRLTKSYKDTYYEILESDIISCPIELSFNERFDLAVEDYNNDGHPDFAINQWNSLSGGTNCYLFTLPKNRNVKKFNIIEYGEQSNILWLPKEYRGIYSPNFAKESENSFSISFFTSGGVSESIIPLISRDVIEDWFNEHNSDMSEFTLKNIYLCEDENVTLIEQQILEPNGDIWYTSN